MLNDCLKQTEEGVTYNGRMADLDYWLKWTEEGNRNLQELGGLGVRHIKTWDGWMWLGGLKACWTEANRVEKLIEKYADQIAELE